MRTKKINDRFGRKMDKIFWFLISMAPLICYFCFLINSFGDFQTVDSYWGFGSFMRNIFGISPDAPNPFFSVLYNLFGSSSSPFPIFTVNGGLLHFFSYLCVVEVAHVCFDVIVFIPRLAHKWISKAVQDD